MCLLAHDSMESISIDCLNHYGKDKGLRMAKSWAQARIFLHEEHAPELLPLDHVFPWDIPPDGDGPAAPLAPLYDSELSTTTCGPTSSERGEMTKTSRLKQMGRTSGGVKASTSVP